MKLFYKLDYFWNSSLANLSLTNSSSIQYCCTLLGTRVCETRILAQTQIYLTQVSKSSLTYKIVSNACYAPNFFSKKLLCWKFCPSAFIPLFGWPTITAGPRSEPETSFRPFLLSSSTVAYKAYNDSPFWSFFIFLLHKQTSYWTLKYGIEDPTHTLYSKGLSIEPYRLSVF